VLYKLFALQSTSDEGDGSDMLIPFCPKLLYLLGDVLLKTQNDDVRLNCIGSLSIFNFNILFLEKNACNLLFCFWVSICFSLLVSLFWTGSDNRIGCSFLFFPLMTKLYHECRQKGRFPTSISLKKYAPLSTKFSHLLTSY